MTSTDGLGEALVDGVLRLLTDLDPYFLDPGGPEGVPAGEYDIEARPLAKLLSQNGFITPEQVDAVWLEYFDEPVSDVVGEDRARELVAGLNGLIHRTRG
jgi:hypothetical protein